MTGQLVLSIVDERSHMVDSMIGHVLTVSHAIRTGSLRLVDWDARLSVLDGQAS